MQPVETRSIASLQKHLVNQERLRNSMPQARWFRQWFCNALFDGRSEDWIRGRLGIRIFSFRG